jgi:type IV pilus assembly protein PilP
MKKLAYMLCCASLVACSSSSEDSIRQWMVEERNQTKPNVKPLEPPKQFVPEGYKNASALEPFSNQKLTQALKSDAPSTSAASQELIASELTRRKEPLEAYPLDSMALVGTLMRAGKPVALIKVDNLLYQVKVGDHLGQNFGEVIQITELEVTLREKAQDAVGEWVKRVATLQLQEKSK